MRRHLAAVAFLLALTAVFYWRLTISRQYSWLEGTDTAFQVRPWLDYQAREFHAGRFPIWAPNEWGGQSLIGQTQPGATNPLNWILFAMPLRDGHIPLGVLHWYWVLIHWVGAVFCYALCRELKASAPASLLGACIFALTGFLGHTDWPQMLMPAVWLPLALLGFARVFRGARPRSGAALSGAALGLAFLSGHHQIPIDATLLFGVLWVWYLVPRWRDRRAWVYATIFGAILLLVSAFQILPALEYGRHAVRWAGAPEPLRWRDLVPWNVHETYSLPWKAIAGLVLSRLRFHMNPFVGFTAAALALSSLWFFRRSRDVRLASVFALGGLILALGANTFVYRLAYSYVPLVEKARTPAMAIVLAQLGIAALAAIGLQAWTSKRPRLAWLALPLFLLEAVYAAPHFARLDRPGAYWKMMRDQSDIARFLRGRPGWFRVQASEDDIPYNFGDFFGIEQFGAYVASMPENTYHVLGRPDTPRLLGIRYRIGRTPAESSEAEVFRSASGLGVFENSAIAEPLWTFPDPPCGATGSVRLIYRRPEAMAVVADLPCPSLVVAGDPFFKGWEARVDGRPARIAEFARIVRSVRVSAGRHRIEFAYAPGTVEWGAALTALGLAAAAILWARERRTGASKHSTLLDRVAADGAHR
ncbi:MAG: YfhO family protein [Acidobacteriia bacterium]|nr:YfhO family protein [Terriglobia bacterium]